MTDQPPRGAAHEPGSTPPQPSPNSHLLVGGEWLARHLEDPTLRIVDVRARDEYARGHLGGALSAPLDLFRRPVNGVPGMVVAPETVEEILGGLGISNGSTVVVYDETGGLDAARVFWTLEYFGHPEVRFLEGGIALWRQEGRPLMEEIPEAKPARYRATVHPERVATLSEVRASVGRPDVVVVDTRTAKEYTGEEIRPGTARGGHVPGAIHVNWVIHRTDSQPPRFRPLAELRQIYRSARVTPDREVITYCRTAHRASHTYFVLRLLGYPRIRLYDGSWAEWSYDPEAPVEAGAAP